MTAEQRQLAKELHPDLNGGDHSRVGEFIALMKKARRRLCGRTGCNNQLLRKKSNYCSQLCWKMAHFYDAKIAACLVALLLTSCSTPKKVAPAAYQSPLGVPLIAPQHIAKGVMVRESTPREQPAAIFAAPALPTATWAIYDMISLCTPSEQANWRFNVRSSNVLTTKPKQWRVIQTIPVDPPQFTVIKTNTQQYFMVTITNVGTGVFTNGVYEFTIGNNRQPF